MTRTAGEIISQLQAHANPKNVEGMARFGINQRNTLGVSIPIIRGMAKEIGKNHLLAQELWRSEVHEARVLAALVDDAKHISEAQMEEWVKGFDSWDVCDQVCSNLFDKTPFAYKKAFEWAKRREEFVKRAGFVLMACLAVHDKKAGDEKMAAFLPIVVKSTDDGRNFVKKAVNWALRQIGKRNAALNKKAIQTAREIQKTGLNPAKWIAADALRELESEQVRKKVLGK